MFGWVNNLQHQQHIQLKSQKWGLGEKNMCILCHYLIEIEIERLFPKNSHLKNHPQKEKILNIKMTRMDNK